MTPPQVVTVGDAFVDISARAAAFPPRGGNTWAEAPQVQPGGTVANVAVGLARLGVSTGFVGKVGDDLYGRYIADNLQHEGVDTAGLIRDPRAYTGVVFMVVDAEGERTFFGCGRGSAQMQLRPEDLPESYLAGARTLVTSGVCLVESPAREALLAAMRLARTHGLSVFFDPNLRLEGETFDPGLRAAVESAIALATTILIGDGELASLFPGVEAEAAVQQLLAHGAAEVVLKAGAQGARGVRPGAIVSEPAFAVEVVDTTGAGDAFDAGFIAARVGGADLRAALRYANGVAALSITRHGARSGPTAPEVDRFLRAR